MAQQAKPQILKVTFEGVRDIMFDRYPGDNNTQLPTEQKLYLEGDIVGLPSENILSFLTAENTQSIPKMVYDSRQYKKFTSALSYSLSIEKEFLPLTRNGKEITFNGVFDKEKGQKGGCGIYSLFAVPKLQNGVPNPKERPVVQLPWALDVDLELDSNDVINLQELLNLLRKGGKQLGLGTWRKRFGKFSVKVREICNVEIQEEILELQEVS